MNRSQPFLTLLWYTIILQYEFIYLYKTSDPLLSNKTVKLLKVNPYWTLKWVVLFVKVQNTLNWYKGTLKCLVWTGFQVIQVFQVIQYFRLFSFLDYLHFQDIQVFRFSGYSSFRLFRFTGYSGLVSSRFQYLLKPFNR